MNKHIVVYGCMRSATLWLSQMFQKNVLPKEDCYARHEGFKKEPLSRAFRQWNTDGIHINVGYDGSILDALYEQFPDLQLAVLVRDPVDHIMSVFSHTQMSHVNPLLDSGILMAAAYQWGALELVLGTAKALGIDTKVWHFDYYTTLEGFIEMAQSLGLTTKNPSQPIKPMNYSNRTAGPAIEDYPEPTNRLLRKLQSRFVLAGPAYAEAKAYADERLGR